MDDLTAALGAACGAGLAALALAAFAATLVVLVLGGPFERALKRIFRDSVGETNRD